MHTAWSAVVIPPEIVDDSYTSEEYFPGTAWLRQYQWSNPEEYG